MKIISQLSLFDDTFEERIIFAVATLTQRLI